MMEATKEQMVDPADEALPVGTNLCGDQFTITKRLGAGGFGITYKAMDNVLGRTIVIKECFPEGFCYRKGKKVVARNKAHAEPVRSIVEMFMREAQSLAKIRHPNVVGVHRAFEENETAYMALDLIDGKDLFDILALNPSLLTPERIRGILMQLLDAIEKVHELDLLHRDISPDNIIIEKTGIPVLIDFGAARSDASRRTRAITSMVMVKDGYSPQEFYVAGSYQTPSSDLYALAATFYHVLSGEPPENAQARMIEVSGNKPDPCKPLAGRIGGYDRSFLQAIDTAMKLHPSERLQSAAEWRYLITEASVSSNESEAKPGQNVNLDLELSLSQLVEETNDVVRKTKLIAVEEPKEPEPEAPKPDVPDWVEEFNQESMGPEAPDDLFDLSDPAPAVNTARAPTPSARPKTRVQMPNPRKKPDYASARTRFEYVEAPDAADADYNTDWVNRAAEKEMRLREEREKLRQAMVAEKSAKRRSKITAIIDSKEPTPEMLRKGVPWYALIGPMAKYLAAGVFMGLLLFLIIGIMNPSVFNIN